MSSFINSNVIRSISSSSSSSVLYEDISGHCGRSLGSSVALWSSLREVVIWVAPGNINDFWAKYMSTSVTTGLQEAQDSIPNHPWPQGVQDTSTMKLLLLLLCLQSPMVTSRPAPPSCHPEGLRAKVTQVRIGLRCFDLSLVIATRFFSSKIAPICKHFIFNCADYLFQLE